MKLVSIVVPCYNEQEVLPMFYEEITKVTGQMSKDYPELTFEYLFIDDGSKDKTLEIFRSLADKDKRVRYISFSRNFGKESGMYAGLKNAKGDYIVVMDADLQHPPSFLPQMYSYVRNGEFDCATTRRVSRKGESKVRSWFARKFYKIMNKDLSDRDCRRSAGLPLYVKTNGRRYSRYERIQPLFKGNFQLGRIQNKIHRIRKR